MRLLMHLIAHVCGLEVGEFVYTLGDYHIYQNHLEQVEELLAREPFPLPKLEILDEGKRLRGLEGLLEMRYENLKADGLSIPRKDCGRGGGVGQTFLSVQLQSDGECFC